MAAVTLLDQSVEQQRRVRELVNLFSQRDSRDELGLGRIRDAFSDVLFPGTSVLQTRARYFLIVPWLFTAGAARRGRTDLARRVNTEERRLIEVLRSEGAVQGLIGRQAGAAVKLLPSTIYWNGLVRFGILQVDRTPEQLGRAAASIDPAADELVEAGGGDWHPGLPPAPEGFPSAVPGGFDLTQAEASWLRERILATAPESLLAHLVSAPLPPDPGAVAAWDDQTAQNAPGPIAEWLHHAQLFSRTFNGAALLYNLLLATAYEAAGCQAVDAPVDWYRGALDAWQDEVALVAQDPREWDRRDLRLRIQALNPRIGLPTWSFVEAWLELVIDEGVTSVAEDGRARQLVAARERSQKGRQSRLGNTKLLERWSGASGARPLDYRWSTARMIVTDIVTAAGGDDAGA